MRANLFADYDKATQVALDTLVDAEIKTFPVNVFLIFERYSEIHISTYDEYAHTNSIPVEKIIKEHSKDGFTLNPSGTTEFFVFYNDQQTTTRIPFTLAHEIGHILLGHFEEYPNYQSYSNGTMGIYDELEKEANCFARNLLSPSFYAKKLMDIHGYECSYDGNRRKMVWNVTHRTEITEHLRYIPRPSTLFETAFGISTQAGDKREDLLSTDCTHSKDWLKKNSLDISFTSDWICTNCEERRIGRARFCTNCGQDSGFTYKITQSKPIPDVPIDTLYKFTICPICGNDEISDNAEYCKICGSPLYNRCTKNPNHLNHPMANYCWQCGEPTVFHEKKINNFLMGL